MTPGRGSGPHEGDRTTAQPLQTDDGAKRTDRGQSSPPTTDTARRGHVQRDERTGWKRPRGDDDAPHPFAVDIERHRVICRECPWFWERIGASAADLRAMGQRHRANVRDGFVEVSR